MLWVFVLRLWCDQSEIMALFMVFEMWIGPGFLSLVVNFLFFIAIFLLLILD